MPEYTDHVLRMTEARHKALSARISYDALKKEVDLVRTFEASRRYDPSRVRQHSLPRRLLTSHPAAAMQRGDAADVSGGGGWGVAWACAWTVCERREGALGSCCVVRTARLHFSLYVRHQYA